MPVYLCDLVHTRDGKHFGSAFQERNMPRPTDLVYDETETCGPEGRHFKPKKTMLAKIAEWLVFPPPDMMSDYLHMDWF